MKKLLIILLLMPCTAFAYDDVESTHIYIACLAKYEKKMRIDSTNPEGLMNMCRPQMYDFMRYNCPDNDESCAGLPIWFAAKVIEKIHG